MKTLKERYYVMMVVILVIIGLVYLATLQHYASEKTQTQLEIQNLQNQAIQLSNEKETLGKQLDDKQSMLMIKEEELRNKSQEIDKTIAYFDSYFKAYNYFSTATSSSASGDYYYGLASTEYDYDSYQYVISYCEEARIYYSDATQYYHNAEALFQKTKGLAPDEESQILMDKYVMLMDSGAKIQYSMYQVCEYFESAALQFSFYALYYDQYYLSIGNEAINQMNEKIKDHDREVPKFNKYLAEVTALLEV